MLKRLLRKILPNPFNTLLFKMKKRGQHRFLIYWNRGMGDIALGLYGLVTRIRESIPHAEITFVTRSDLEEAFLLLDEVKVIVDPHMVRGVTYVLDKRIDQTEYDIVIQKPDPTYWLKDQLGTLVPKLHWDPHFDHVQQTKKPCVGMHVSTETGQFYGYEKNWPHEKWKRLIQQLNEQGIEVILFGLKRDHLFDDCNVTDMRGKTRLIEMLSIIKNRCTHLVAPDSGVLSLVYYIDTPFDLKLISLWSDPRQGILKAAVKSPNPQLEHISLVKDDLRHLSVDSVLDVI